MASMKLLLGSISEQIPQIQNNRFDWSNFFLVLRKESSVEELILTIACSETVKNL